MSNAKKLAEREKLLLAYCAGVLSALRPAWTAWASGSWPLANLALMST